MPHKITSLITFLLLTHAHAEVLRFAVRGTEHLRSLKCEDCRQIQAQTREFANGNTDVKIEDRDLMGQEVVVTVPESMTSNQFMEALIKVRLAHNQGAKSVTVEVVEGSKDRMRVLELYGQEISLNFNLLFAIAGASDLTDSFQKEKPIEDEPHLRALFLTKVTKSFGKKIKSWRIEAINHPDLAKEVANHLGIPFSSSGPQNSVIVMLSQPQAQGQEPSQAVNENLFLAVSRVQRLANEGKCVHMLMPYVAYARSDKADRSGAINSEDLSERPGVTTTAALVADIFQISGVQSFSYVRAHAPQISGFYSERAVRETSSFRTLRDYLSQQRVDFIISPDAGGQKEATKFAKSIGVPVAVINKERSDDITIPHGISMPDSQSIQGKTVVIIDDETLSGSTLKDAAKIAKHMGASKVIVAVTHLGGQASALISSQIVDEIVVTDTIPFERIPYQTTVLSIAREIADMLKSMVKQQTPLPPPTRPFENRPLKPFKPF